MAQPEASDLLAQRDLQPKRHAGATARRTDRDQELSARKLRPDRNPRLAAPGGTAGRKAGTGHRGTGNGSRAAPTPHGTGIQRADLEADAVARARQPEIQPPARL